MTTHLINLTNPQAVIAAVPHLMRFVPSNSVVAILLEPTDGARPVVPKVCMRFDITLSVEQATTLPATINLTAEQYGAALLVAVCDTEFDRRARKLLDALRDALRRSGIPVTGRLMTHTVTEADRWVDPDTGDSGPTIPYTDSPATAAGVLAGEVIATSREAIVAEFDLAEPAAYPAVDGDFEDLVADTVTELRATITESRTPTAELAAQAAIVVAAHTGLRDAVVRVGAGYDDDAARTWTRIAAQLRGTARAQALTLAALHYYLAGDATRVGIALDEAGAATPGATPRLARLLDAALQRQIPPSELRRIIPTRDTHPLPGTDL